MRGSNTPDWSIEVRRTFICSGSICSLSWVLLCVKIEVDDFRPVGVVGFVVALRRTSTEISSSEWSDWCARKRAKYRYFGSFSRKSDKDTTKWGWSICVFGRPVVTVICDAVSGAWDSLVRTL